jgi:hypothetical protein
MSALLSGAAAEVLRALVLGLELRVKQSGWEFVGPWQHPFNSGVSQAVSAELLAAGYVRHGDGLRIEITDEGRNALQNRTTAVVTDALEWVRFLEPNLSSGSQSETS